MKVLRIAFLSTLGLLLLLGVILSARVYLDSGARAANLIKEAQVLEQEGKTDQALDMYRKAADKAPKHIEAVTPYLERAENISQEEFKKRAQPFTEADYLYPDQLRILITGARRTEESELLGVFAKRLLTDFPGESTSLLLAADSFYSSGKKERAASLYEAAIQADPENREAKLHYAQLLLATEDPINSIRAKVFLRSAAEAEDDVSLRAILMLVTNPNLALSMQERTEYLQLLTEHPSFTEGEELITGNLALLRVLSSQLALVDINLAHQVGLWRLNHPDAGPEDKISQLYLAQRVGKLDEAKKLLESMKDDSSPALASLRAHQKALQGDVMGGLEDLRALLAETPDNAQALNILIQLRQRGEEDERWLAPTEKIALNELILEHKLAPAEIKLASVDVLLALQPLKQEQVIEKATAALAEQKPLLASSLVNNGHANEALLVATEQAATEDPALGKLRVLALLGVNQVDDARAQLAALPSLPAADERMLAMLIEIADKNLDKAKSLWEEAFEAASQAGDDNRLLLLARTGVQLGDPKYPLDAYSAAFERGLNLSENDWLSYFSLLLETRQEDRAQVVAERMLRLNPENPVFVNNAAYLNLLSGQELARSLRVIQEASEEHPDLPNLKMTLALAYLLNGSPREALSTAESAQQDWEEPPAAARAIYAAILAANNQSGLARALAMAIDKDNLLDKERELLSRLLPGN